ncbi:MAG: translation elongation factor-like protein [Candidatus Thorarchaeota archaeon]|nr:MAG: translation elongation factor-like protein [Candidatus Thorarchaeota archaeon]
MSAKKTKKKQVGVVTRFFSNISVAAIKLEQPLRMGNKISIEGPLGAIEQVIESMQIDRKPIQQGAPGQEIAIKVKSPVRENDKVFVLE